MRLVKKSGGDYLGAKINIRSTQMQGKALKQKIGCFGKFPVGGLE